MGLLDDSNVLAGAFNKPGLSRSVEKRERSARRWAIAGIVLSLLWLFGIGSVLGALAGGLARLDAESTEARRLANIALGLALLGIVAPVAWFVIL